MSQVLSGNVRCHSALCIGPQERPEMLGVSRHRNKYVHTYFINYQFSRDELCLTSFEASANLRR
jgi:hypothetical protein